MSMKVFSLRLPFGALIFWSALSLNGCCMNNMSGCCMANTSEWMIYKAKIVSDSCSVAGTNLFVSHGPKIRPLRDAKGNLLELSGADSADEAGVIFFKGGGTQSRCPGEAPDYLHSAPLLVYFDHPTCKDYYDSIPAERLNKLVRITPEEAGYALGPYEIGVWQLPVLHIEPDTAYFEATD
jgi:hypothetical protein